MNYQLIGAVVLGLSAVAAAAQERIELYNVYAMNQETFQLSDSIYYMQDNRGFFEVLEGPIAEGPARCVGGGFGHQDGRSDITGLCIFGEGDDTFTMRWKAGEQGAANTWVIVAGTGRYTGMTGDGIATTGVEIMYHAQPRRRTHIVGMVTLP